MAVRSQRKKEQRSRCAKGGAIAGCVGGLVMLFLSLASYGIDGKDPWIALKLPAICIVGRQALEPGFAFGPILAGLVCHFSISTLLGVIFGCDAYGLSKPLTVAVGLFYGILVWVAMMFFILPNLGLVDIWEIIPLGASILEHAGFGLSLGVGFLRYQRVRLLVLVNNQLP